MWIMLSWKWPIFNEVSCCQLKICWHFSSLFPWKSKFKFIILFNLGFNLVGLDLLWLEIELVEEQRLTTLECNQKNCWNRKNKVINIKFWCIQKNNQLAQFENKFIPWFCLFITHLVITCKSSVFFFYTSFTSPLTYIITTIKLKNNKIGNWLNIKVHPWRQVT